MRLLNSLTHNMDQVKSSLERFINKALEVTPDRYFVSDHDPEWRSACEFHQQDGQTHWRPIEQSKPLDFSGLGNAADAEIHPDIQAYFSAFWSGSLQGKTEEGLVSLIQLWNEEDFTRLLENLIGHLLMKNRAKLPFTVFFATTEPESELFLSIENATGRILLEEPGKPPIREVDDNIINFLHRLEADPTPAWIY